MVAIAENNPFSDASNSNLPFPGAALNKEGKVLAKHFYALSWYYDFNFHKDSILRTHQSMQDRKIQLHLNPEEVQEARYCHTVCK